MLQRSTGSLLISGRAPERYAYALIKRTLDIVIAGSLLLITSPLILLLACLVVLDTPGPVFFRHTRIGLSGEPFELWKLRSMYVDAARYDHSPASAIDSRVTRAGRWMRRLSLDEIPQLINVLRGEMSLVGPRPEMPFIVQHYSALERLRLEVKPGITGIWQISTARAHPIHHNIQYDLYYIRHANFMLDIAILARTLTAVVRGVGAV